MKRSVLITGARAPVAIDLARSFASAGYEILLADSAPAWAARWSKVGRGRLYPLPPARSNFPSYADALERLVSDKQPELVIPTCEEVFYVAAAGAARGFADRVFAPPLPVLERLHSKIRFQSLLSELGLKGPDTWRITSRDDLGKLPLTRETLVLKPEFSRFGTATLIRPTSRQLERFVVDGGQAWAAQRFVEGEELCFWSAAREGRIVASALYRPKWRQGRSASYLFERTVDPVISSIAERIAEAIGMTGQMSFDLIRTATGDVLPIECNPRSISGLHLFMGDPALARAIAGEGPAVLPIAQIQYLAPAMAVLGLPAAIHARQIAAFLDDWGRGSDALCRQGEWLPWLGALLDAGRFALLGLSRRNSAAGQSTDDIEWNGEPIG